MSTNLTILAALAAVTGFWLARRARPAAWPERLAAFLLPALLGTLVYAYAETAVLCTNWTWSACRLAPTIALFHGYPLYPPEAGGVITDWHYGPVAALAWSPAALADSPQPALMTAAVINLLFLLVPLLAAAWRATAGRLLPALLVFALGAAGILQLYPTWYMASALNVDAIAVGLGAGSCLVLVRAGVPSGKHLLLAAALSVLAVWTKQNDATLILAQAGWLWFRHGRTAARQLSVAFAGAMAGVIGLVAVVLHPADVFFNLWTIPFSEALPGGWSAAGAEAMDFLLYTAVLWLPCLLAALWPPAAAPGASEPAPRSQLPLWLFVAAAAALLPTGIVAAIKIGGDRNSIHSVYYLAVAAILAVGGAWPARAGRNAALGHSAILVATAVVVALAARQAASYPDRPLLPRRCLSQEAWAVALRHPEQVYFPWDPLATLMAEGRLYHFEYGVIDRIYVGRAPAPGALNAGLPARLSVVVYPRAPYPQTMRERYLPPLTLASTTEDWLIYRKAEAH